MMDGHFIARENVRHANGRVKQKRRQGRRARSLEESYFGFANELHTNQTYRCLNCGYQDYVSDETAFYYLVFGDFRNAEPAGFECANCGGPLTEA